MSKLAILSAAALLVGSYNFASAQSTPGTSGQSGAGSSQSQCWDAATNQVRQKSAATGSGSSGTGAGGPSGSSAGASGSTATGSGTPGTTGSGGGAATSGSGNAASRPAGMQNC